MALQFSLSSNVLRSAWPKASAELIDGFVEKYEDIFSRYGITTWIRAVHFMAQISHESNGGTVTKESLYYTTPGRLQQVWPSRFPTTASALPYVRNERALASKVYNGRMGNVPGTEDGYTYRGRGLLQLTGRESYRKIGDKIGVDLIADPDKVFDPAVALEIAACEFRDLNTLPFCDRDDLRGVTHHVNGGLTGLTDRANWLARWKRILPKDAPTASPVALAGVSKKKASPGVTVNEVGVVSQPEPDGLKYGDNDWKVKALQQRLTDLNYFVGSVDGDFGPSTRAAVLAFQADNALPTTGVVDAATEAALATAPPKPVSEARQNKTVDDLAKSGSATAQTSFSISRWAKVILGVGAAGAADNTGLIESAKSVTDNYETVKGIMETLQEAITWGHEHIWLVLVFVAIFLMWQARKIAIARLMDARDGANLRR